MRLPRVRKSAPSASYSDSCQPTPTPSRTRPPESVSSVPICLATSVGSRCGSTSTSVPSVTRDVTAASAASVTSGSRIGMAGL